MLKVPIQNKTNEIKLYNKILLLSRNKFFYTKMSLKDTFENRIYLIFIHICFLFIKINNEKDKLFYKKFYQKIFDFTFKQIEANMREIGHGDVTVNKNMKFLIKTFYNILLNCENYSKKSSKEKILFLQNYLIHKNSKMTYQNNMLVEYFDNFQSFCFYLSLDSVLKGELNFKYK